jgi:hypothetical protein
MACLSKSDLNTFHVKPTSFEFLYFIFCFKRLQRIWAQQPLLIGRCLLQIMEWHRMVAVDLWPARNLLSLAALKKRGDPLIGVCFAGVQFWEYTTCCMD